MRPIREVHVVVPRPRLRRAIASFWLEAGFSPVPLLSAKAARARLLHGPRPAALVLDFMSPAVRAFHAWLRRHASFARIPVIAVVARPEEIEGVVATVTRPRSLEPWLGAYELVRASLSEDESELVSVRPAA